MGLELRNMEDVTAPNALEVFIGILAVICAPSSCQFAPQARFSSPGRLCCSILRPGCLHFAPQAQKSRGEWIFASMMLPFCAPGHVFFNLLPTFGPLLAYSSTLSLLLVFLLLQLLQIPTTTKTKNKKGLKAIENPRN